MLFFLRASDGSLQYLLKDKQYTVGRRVCDILLTNDQSISRKHAVLTVKNNTVSVEDCGSRYNTFVDKTKIEAGVAVMVNSGSTIHFGQLQSIYTLEEIPIVTTTSSIRSDQKANLRSNINFLGGSILPNWALQCTHVTVEEIMLTAKVLCAIVQGIPIVKLKYWDDYVANVQQNLAPPDVASYVPNCSEVMLGKNVSVGYKEERKSLFKNKVFVFPTKSEKAKIVDMITLAGGEAISWDTSPLTRADLKESAKEYIILQTSELSDQKLCDTLLDFISCYTQLGKRTIPLQEIALAIVRCSCEKDCNPDFDRKGVVLASSTQREFQMNSENILALPTQTPKSCSAGQVKAGEIIPQSVDLDISVIEKMELSEDPLEGVTLNKIEQNEVIKNSVPSEAEISSSIKRESESLDHLNAPKKVKVEATPFFMKKTKPKKETNSNESKCDIREARGEPSGRPLFAFKRDKISNEGTSSTTESPNPFSRKRKALQGDSTENPSKKPIPVGDSLSTPSTSVASTSRSMVQNPFANILKHKSSASPSSTKTSQSPSSFFKSKSGPQASSTMINGNVSSLQVDSSAIVVVDSRLEKSYGWIAKSTKHSYDKEATVNGNASEVDLELLRYIESFKNTVVIEDEKEEIIKRADNNNDASVVNNNIKNFKIFKKIQPLKLQTMIIPEATYVDVICNRNCAIEVVRADSEDDSDDGIDSQVRTARRKGKRYQF